jgi:hypothetical protein
MRVVDAAPVGQPEHGEISKSQRSYWKKEKTLVVVYTVQTFGLLPNWRFLDFQTTQAEKDKSLVERPKYYVVHFATWKFSRRFRTCCIVRVPFPTRS